MSARHWIIGGVMALVAATLGSFGTLAYATHVFNDIPDTTFFADSIESIADAGCAGGFPDGSFRQNDPATRGQFAYWTANCGGRSAWNSEQIADLASNSVDTISPVSIAPGGIPGNTGFIVLQANATFYDADGIECPCRVNLSINHVGTGNTVGRVATESLDGNVSGSGGLFASLSTSGRFVATTAGNDVSEKFEVVVGMTDDNNNPVIVSADLTAIYTPFGPFGTDLP